MYQGMASAMPQTLRLKDWGFSPCLLMTCQMSEAVRVVLWRMDQSSFDWVECDVFSELEEIFVLVDADL